MPWEETINRPLPRTARSGSGSIRPEIWSIPLRLGVIPADSWSIPIDLGVIPAAHGMVLSEL